MDRSREVLEDLISYLSDKGQIPTNKDVKDYWSNHILPRPAIDNRPAFKHEMLKYRILSLIENKFLGGRRIGGFKNYKSIRT